MSKKRIFHARSFFQPNLTSMKKTARGKSPSSAKPFPTIYITFTYESWCEWKPPEIFLGNSSRSDFRWIKAVGAEFWNYAPSTLIAQFYCIIFFRSLIAFSFLLLAFFSCRYAYTGIFQSQYCLIYIAWYLNFRKAFDVKI